MSIFKKAILATTLAASALVATASPVMARDTYRQNDNTAGVAIGVGIIGLALGAIIASNNNNDRYHDGRYYDRRYDGHHAQAYRYNRNDNRARDWQHRSAGYDDRYYARRGY